MTLNNLFQVKNGKATITDHCRTNAYYNQIIKEHGEDISVKIFTVFQYMADLNPDTNPYSHLSEIDKLETIIRACAADLPLSVDWDDEILQEGIEITRKLFETPAYRKYLSVKSLNDKLIDTVHNASVSVNKDDGNMSELTKALSMLDATNESVKKAYSEFEAENGAVQRKGGRKAVTRTVGGKAVELD